MTKKHLFLFIIITTILLASCQSTERKTTNNFYYWKQTFQLNSTEKAYLDELNTRTLYLKLFDVSWSFTKSQPTVVAPIRFKEAVPSNIKIIPTIFITNQTLVELPKQNINELTQLILTTVESAMQSQNITISGLQIDCDWTLSTRDKYFELLKNIKAQFNQELSATIRLHQIKFYKKTGIPPVDRGTLMFYNMDAVTDSSTSNSILDLEIARQYFYNFEKYDLPLDVAFPLFRWGVVRRRGRVIQLLNNLSDEDLDDETLFLKEKENHYQVLKSHYLKGFYLYTDDKIRLENVSLPDLKESAQLLNGIIRQDTLINVTYYHLDSTALQHYSTKEIQSVTRQFLE